MKIISKRPSRKNVLLFVGLLLLGGFLLLRFKHLGAFKGKVNCPLQAACTEIAAIPGPEDFHLDRKTGMLYVSSDNRCIAKKQQAERGGIYSINLLDTAFSTVLITPAEPADFHPQGIALYANEDGRQVVFAVNHRASGEQTVEIFDLGDDGFLSFRKTIRDSLLVWPNDVIGVGTEAFYVTNVSRYGKSAGRKMDAFLNLKGGYAAYFDGNQMRVVAGHLSYPNGINISREGELVFISETISGNLKVFERDPEGGGLTLVRKKFIGYGLDNIAVDENDELWIALHPSLIKLGKHIKKPQQPSPAKVVRLNGLRGNFEKELVFCSSGEDIAGVSIAVPFDNYLYLGQVCGPKLYRWPMPEKKEVMSLKKWREKGRFKTINGHRIFFLDEGIGEALLMLHAYPTASWGWHRMWPELSLRFRLIAPDLLGSGFSDKPQGKSHYSILNLSGQLESLLQELGIKEVHILANAYGVSVAQELLARQTETDKEASPFRIKSISFIGGGIFSEVAKTTAMQKLLLTPLGSTLAKTFPASYKTFKRNFSKTFGSDHPAGEAVLMASWQLLNYNDGISRVPEVIRYLKERRQWRDRWVDAMQQTEIPLCLINGQTDRLTGKAINVRWQELLPASPLYVLPGDVGHYPPLEVPGAVLEAFFTFVDEHLGSAS